ncbi:sigma-70 family RNA polymerase sigma factor [Catellatospora sp. KI3]|uniref:sigma-70 family RNA polymerase sigma factor n=1 Tax=Catellatospora sp. KI3 TaxID=3041620 RepID=UPI002482A9DB|nr:sigma-70 family RNA polymerase sigma factor [Catellatospora sp. KI3]MDI1459722.1 sigma-70 family RNA polymerase sigma factor [Catellatospora sp. KI3]
MRSDTSLARGAIAGDRDAFDRLYRQYRPGLLGFVVRQVGDVHLAEDVVQETFLVAWRDLDKLRDPAALKTWLFSIAYRRAMSAAGRVSPGPLPEELLADDDRGRRPEAAAEQREAYELVWNAAHALEPRQRAVLELTLRWDLSSREVGEVLGVGPTHAAVLVHRSRKALGSAVRTMLVARQHGRCAGLDAIAPGHRRLNARERGRVDRHINQCEHCRRLRTKVSAYAVLGLLFTAGMARSGGGAGRRWALRLAGVVTAVSVLATGVYALMPPGGGELDGVGARPRGGVAASPDPSATAPTGASPSSSAVPSGSPSAGPSVSASASASPRPTARAPQTLEEQILVLVNAERKKVGCGPVHADARLAKAARLHSEDMAKRDYFSHDTPEGVSPWDRAKAQGYTTPSAENIAAGNATAKATMQQWMNSKGHRANILNCSSKAMGVGRGTGGTYRYYWTQMFGYR